MAPLITEIEIRSAVTAQASGSRGTPGDYTINPYRGCAFGCSYCYASKFVYDDAAKRAQWGHWVEVKRNVVSALGRDAPKLFDKSIWLGSATDPYQPIELRLQLTRAILEVLLMAYPKHLHLQTRSPHVVRDIDLFQRFGDTITVGISIPTDSDTVRKAFEPRAPSIARRLEAARTLHEAGVPVTVAVAPLLPCTPQRLARLLRPVCDRVWVGGINLYDKADPVRNIYEQHGWNDFLRREHIAQTKKVLSDAGIPV